MIEKVKQAFYSNLYLRSHSRAWYHMWGETFKEITCIFPQFFTLKYPVRTLLRSLGMIVTCACRPLSGRSLFQSYAFTGEDRIIESLLNLKLGQTGYYVDVGCNHPIYFSNTYKFYKKGWRGICIDANHEMIRKYSFYRPKDIAIPALVSSKIEARDFYHFTNNVISTTESKFIESYQAEGQQMRVQKLTTQTLSSILATNNAPTTFDLLAIDAEEHDLEVLKSIDLRIYKPRLIIIENETFNSLDPLRDEILQHLLPHGYAFSGYVLKNMYFLRNQ
jgi:FkbM family methyltransferase